LIGIELSHEGALRVDIFVVDDEPIIAETVVAILKLEGYAAQAFDDPMKALAAIAKGCPKLLIADFIMFDLNGIGLAARVVASCRNCRVIFVTASMNTKPLYDCGLASAVLSKPVAVSDLLRAVREHLPIG
jgi:CheY-like chemotaxis protein